MATSYHTQADDPEDLRAGRPNEERSFHEPKAEAPPAQHAKVRPALISQTGLMPQITLEAEEPLNDCERVQMSAAPLPEQETIMSSSDPVLIDPVLIVEDTVELAEVIEATVLNMGLPTVVANHGSTALEYLQMISPCLLLLDLSLPDINGWEILKAVRELARERNQPVPPTIVITALDDPANRIVGKLEEVNAYLIKPFTPQKIEETIYNVMNAQA